jgi:hypothetical protein
MNESALTFIDLEASRVRLTVLLDEPGRGAANPWALAWTPDEGTICVSHSGTHDLSLIDAEGLLQRASAPVQHPLVNDLAFLKGLRTRVQLPINGPRALVVDKGRALVAGFFSDSIAEVDWERARVLRSMPVRGSGARTEIERGEQLFHDATIAHQSWQSCASCHPEGRMDGLNWDLLNDGIGNPKNTKSLVLSHRTPPAMSTGIRTTASSSGPSSISKIGRGSSPTPTG